MVKGDVVEYKAISGEDGYTGMPQHDGSIGVITHVPKTKLGDLPIADVRWLVDTAEKETLHHCDSFNQHILNVIGHIDE